MVHSEGIKRFISKMKSNTEVVYKGQIIKVKELWDIVKLKPVSGRSIKEGAVLVIGTFSEFLTWIR